MHKITKAVFPVAGMGTRFLPATKASPKEMLAIVDKPLIQYVVEEAIAAGITDLIFITGRNKRAIEDHFDVTPELESLLESKNKDKLLSMVQNILPAHVNCIFIRQAEALGLGHAVLCAKPVIGDDAFAVLLADDLIDATPGVLTQMLAVFEETKSSVLGVEEVKPEETSSYGIVAIEPSLAAYAKVVNIVEKPAPEHAPSNLAVVGRYILSANIFAELSQIQAGAGGEIQLTDGIHRLMEKEAVYALSLQGKRYDCGSKIGYLKATVEYGLKHAEVGDEFKQYLKNFQNTLDTI